MVFLELLGGLVILTFYVVLYACAAALAVIAVLVQVIATLVRHLLWRRAMRKRVRGLVLEHYPTARRVAARPRVPPARPKGVSWRR